MFVSFYQCQNKGSDFAHVQIAILVFELTETAPNMQSNCLSKENTITTQSQVKSLPSFIPKRD